MKNKNYTIDEIFSRRLYFLIPFYIFKRESCFQVYNKNGDRTAIRKRAEGGEVSNVRTGDTDKGTYDPR